MKYDAVIIDGRHLLYRIAYIYTKKSSLLNSIVYGFIRSCSNIHLELGGELFIAWEGESERNFRFDIFPEYKAKPAPSEETVALLKKMDRQQKLIQRLLAMLGCEQYLGNGGEGDDVIGYLVRTLKSRFDSVAIYSSDSDLRQLVDEKTVLVTPVAGEFIIYTVNRVRVKHGVWPQQIPMLKALTGDKSDKIPGVTGIGPKKAAALLYHYGNVDALIRGAENDSGWPKEVNFKLRKKLLDSENLIRRNMALTTIQQSAILVQAYPKQEGGLNSALALAEDLGLQSIYADMRKLFRGVQ